MGSEDTSPAALRVQREALARRSGAERVAMVAEMSAATRGLLIDAIRRRQPDISEFDLRIAVIERMHGSEVAARVAAATPI